MVKMKKGKIVKLKTTKKPYAFVPPGKGKIRLFKTRKALRAYRMRK